MEAAGSGENFLIPLATPTTKTSNNAKPATEARAGEVATKTVTSQAPTTDSKSLVKVENKMDAVVDEGMEDGGEAKGGPSGSNKHSLPLPANSKGITIP